MRKFSVFTPCVCLISLILLVSACGQKGPLVLPATQAHQSGEHVIVSPSESPNESAEEQSHQ